MIPTQRLFTLIWVWAIIGIAAGFSEPLINYWKVIGFVILCLLLIDIFYLLQSNKLHWTRNIKSILPVGVWSQVGLEVHNPHNRPIVLEFFDYSSSSSETDGLPGVLTLPRRGWAKASYNYKPLKRGDYDFMKLQVRILGMLGLLKRNCFYDLKTSIRVYPNYKNIIKYSLLAHDQRQAQMGIHKSRRRGEGMEFQQLREYRVGDSLGLVDWNATSRMNKLISREYQDERDQRLIFLVDCSRRMKAMDGDLSHFDHTLNSVILLSYIATRQGDSVGLMTFGGEDRWLSPAKGTGVVNKILNTVYDLHPSLQEADYLQCVTKLTGYFTKRSLIILITNLRDEDSDDLRPSLSLLKKRNLVLLSSMRERSIDDLLAAPIAGFEEALDYAAATKYLEYRNKLQAQISQAGVFTLDVNPDQLAISLVNQYFKIKSAGLL